MDNVAGFITLASHKEIEDRINRVVADLGPPRSGNPEAAYWATREACWASFYSYATWPDSARPVVSPESILSQVDAFVASWKSDAGPSDGFLRRAEASALLGWHRLHRSRWAVERLLGPDGVADQLQSMFSSAAAVGGASTDPSALSDQVPEWREWILERAHVARYGGDDKEATRLYRSAYPARHWANDLSPAPDVPSYGPTVLAHNRVSQVCSSLLLAAPLPQDEGDREAVRELADAGIDLLQTTDPDCSLTADPPRFPNFAANHAKHLGFFYEVVGKHDLAELYRERAEYLFARVARSASKGDVLRQQFVAHACLVRNDLTDGVERLVKILGVPGLFSYLPKVAHECHTTLLRLAERGLLPMDKVPLPPWGTEPAPAHRLAHRQFVEAVRRITAAHGGR